MLNCLLFYKTANPAGLLGTLAAVGVKGVASILILQSEVMVLHIRLSEPSVKFRTVPPSLVNE